MKKNQQSYSKKEIIINNLIILLWFSIAIYGIFKNSSILGIFYLLFALIMVGLVLRKYLCTNCYYYDKLCWLGWGKLSSFLYKRNSGNYKIGIILVYITWGMLFVIPFMIFIVNLFRKNFLRSDIIYLLIFLGLTLIFQLIRKKACTKCKMKIICKIRLNL